VAGQLNEGARVVAYSSTAHLSPVLFDDINFDLTPYDPWTAYVQSKTPTPCSPWHSTRAPPRTASTCSPYTPAAS